MHSVGHVLTHICAKFYEHWQDYSQEIANNKLYLLKFDPSCRTVQIAQIINLSYALYGACGKVSICSDLY